MKKFIPLLLIFSLLLSGCGQAANLTEGAAVSADADLLAATVSIPASGVDGSDMFSDRDYEVGYDESESAQISLNGASASCDSNAVQISGSTVTIIDEGTYILSGSLDDGMIIVNAENTDKIQLVLDGVSVNSSSSAAIYVLQADKVFITLAPGSVNTLSNGGSFTAIDENNIDAVIYSKDDLTLNGSGTLTISSPAGHGVVSKDDLVITSGEYIISAASHGLSGKDSVRIAGGSFDISSGKDAVQAENSEDTSLGFLYISGGDFKLDAEGDGLSASGYLQIEDGDFDILSGGGCADVVFTQSAWGSFQGGSYASADTTDSVSTKGIKAAGDLVINGGSFQIDALDDALHSNAGLSINGGEYTIATGDDGMHADSQLSITAGTIEITKSYEGIEGLSIAISGGDISLIASDDGLNAAGGNDQSGFGGFHGGDAFAANSDSYINISGGVLNINASGDGIDSNGSLSVSGGETYISGPTDGANGSLDYALEASITGGIFIATGSSQMALNFSSSTQGVIMVSTGAQANGSQVTLSDSSGQTLISWQSEKAFDSIIVSCPEISQSSSYTISAGTYSQQITMSSLIYGSAGMMGMGGMGGAMPGGGMADIPAGEVPTGDGSVPEMPTDGFGGRGQSGGMPGAMGGTPPT